MINKQSKRTRYTLFGDDFFHLVEPILFLVSPCECDVARLRLSACDARDVSDAGDACPSRDRDTGGAEL